MARSEFTNEPLSDFSRAVNNAAFAEALEQVQNELGKNYEMCIDGEWRSSEESFPSINPTRKDEVVGIFPKGTTEDVQAAIDAAWKAFPSWSKTPAAERAEYLFQAASKMRDRKHIFSAWMVVETGKTWVEADADTAEAIDFMEFYAREMLRLSEKQTLTKIPSEENELRYIPLGVGAIIPPWNFPLAICVGMTTAAMVSGNPVVLKPASDSPTIAYQFVKLMEELELPKGVLNFVTGSGSQIGDFLVDHPKIRFISFTGSKEVGLRIIERAAKHQEGQIWIKRVVAEMGGKDGMLIDEQVDVDSAAKGIVAAAFGFQGQKCSACSRAVIHESIYDKVVEKVVELTKHLKVGDPADAEVQVGPVINSSAKKKILSYIEIGKEEGQLLTGGNSIREEGYFVEPTIFENIEANDRLFQEEIFGPVLTLSKCKSFDEGLKMMNNSEYGLTGAVYSSSRENLDKASDDFHVGNLYLNRKCTGALVGVHPFGGFNMSGTDSKAGGRDYLLLFTQAKLISEKIN